MVDPNKTIRVKIEYNAGRPGHSARIIDVETGALIEGAFHVELDALSMPIATIRTYDFDVEIETDARIIKVCPICKRDLEALEAADQEPEGGE